MATRDSGATPMYTVISLWQFGSPAQANEAVRRMRVDFGPLVRRQPGLSHWYLVVTGVAEAATVSLWENRAFYEEALAAMAPWAQQHLADVEARVLHRRRGDVAAYETYQPPDPPGADPRAGETSR